MFKLSQRSLSRLEGVDPRLILLAKEAIKITKVDFGVSEGLRTRERQQQFYKEGKTKTLNSKHITGQAIDLVAYVDGKVSWKIKHYYDIARAMQEICKQQNTPIIWGAIWDTPLNKLSFDLENEVNSYQTRFKRRNPNRRSFFDGPHFELRAKVQ